MRGEWGLFKRKRNKGDVWYYWYYDENGLRQHSSTGKSLKHEAVEFVEKQFSNTSTNSNITLKEFTKDFFEWNKSKWLERRRARGYSVTKPMADMRGGHLKLKIGC